MLYATFKTQESGRMRMNGARNARRFCNCGRKMGIMVDNRVWYAIIIDISQEIRGSSASE